MTTEGRVITGDHTGTLGDVHEGRKGYREVYVNDIGLATIKGTAPYRYPAGTILVKEQYKDKAAWEKKSSPNLTIMVKVTDIEEEEEIELPTAMEIALRRAMDEPGGDQSGQSQQKASKGTKSKREQQEDILSRTLKLSQEASK